MKVCDLARVAVIGVIASYQPDGMGEAAKIEEFEIKCEIECGENQPQDNQGHIRTEERYLEENDAGDRSGKWLYRLIDKIIDTHNIKACLFLSEHEEVYRSCCNSALAILLLSPSRAFRPPAA